MKGKEGNRWYGKKEGIKEGKNDGREGRKE